jgi:Polyketide cyclase / dehydrase and lipid transport
MIDYESSTFIARRAEDVFAFVADVRNDRHWHTDVTWATISIGDDRPAVGTVFDVKGMVSGTEEIIAHEAPHLVVLKGGDMGKIVPIDIRTIDSVDGGVRFTRHVDLEAGGFMSWMTNRMLGRVTKRNDQFVENLKQVLERG